MNNLAFQPHDVDLYTWYRLERALKIYLDSMNSLPSWALKKKIASSLPQLKDIYRERLVYEYNTIKKMGFCGYFLIIADAIEFCEREDIPVGPGRGSAAGCLCAFLLKITEIDPIRFKLLFERFLNPDRISMPDIDTDYSQKHRDRVKEYLISKYGKNYTASIGTFSRMKVRAGIKDVVRSLNLGGAASFALADKISKTLEDADAEVDYQTAFKEIGEFHDFMITYPQVAFHLEKCEDILRQTSTHAAGVLISSVPLDEEIPLLVDKNGVIVTALDGKTVEAQGYLKLDTLGLKNLDVIADCKRNIKKTRGIDLGKIYYAEPVDYIDGEKKADFEARIAKEPIEVQYSSRAFKYLREGKSTLGIFQCDQPVTEDLLRRIKTNSIEEIADVLAGIRPGPRKAGSTDIYIRRKNGEEPYEKWYDLELPDLPEKMQEDIDLHGERAIDFYIKYCEDIIADVEISQRSSPEKEDINLSYSHPSDNDHLTSAPDYVLYKARLKALKEKRELSKFDLRYLASICDSSQGLPFFQEQLMQISVKTANFTKGESDTLRKGVGKKDKKVITKVGKMFMEGMQKTLNASLEEAEYIWYKFILPYGSYGFNLSHSIAYGKITYDTALLKANFPGEMYASLLSHEDDPTAIAALITEAKSEGIKFLPPDVNISTTTFEIVDPKTIVYSLTCMKGLASAATEKIVARRPFTSMVDFIGKAPVNVNQIASLIMCGAFDNAFKDEKVSRKNYYDFYEDCRTKLFRQTDRLLRDKLQRRFNFIPKSAGGEYSPGDYHKKMMEENQEYRDLYTEWELAEIAAFQYDWQSPLTTKAGGKEIVAVERITKDDRDAWSLEEHLDFEEAITGTAISAHRLDPYHSVESKLKFIAADNDWTLIRLGDDLSKLKVNQEVVVFCYASHFVMKRPYKKDPSQFTRIFAIADRTGIRTISMFDKSYHNLLRKDLPRKDPKNPNQKIKVSGSVNPFTLMEDGEMYSSQGGLMRPVMLLKLKVNEYMGTRGLAYESMIQWFNLDRTLDEIEKKKRDELEKIRLEGEKEKKKRSRKAKGDEE